MSRHIDLFDVLPASDTRRKNKLFDFDFDLVTLVGENKTRQRQKQGKERGTFIVNTTSTWTKYPIKHQKKLHNLDESSDQIYDACGPMYSAMVQIITMT